VCAAAAMKPLAERNGFGLTAVCTVSASALRRVLAAPLLVRLCPCVCIKLCVSNAIMLILLSITCVCVIYACLAVVGIRLLLLVLLVCTHKTLVLIAASQ
jgi:hypothetical protein